MSDIIHGKCEEKSGSVLTFSDKKYIIKALNLKEWLAYDFRDSCVVRYRRFFVAFRI